MLTHGHNDHINAAVPLRDAVDAPILLHPDDRMLWDVVWPDHDPDGDVMPGRDDHGRRPLSSASLHTPGHSPGCCCFHDGASGVVFSGDTLFCGGPGATGRSYSDEPTILRSIIVEAARAPARDDRPHRARRLHHDRRRTRRRDGHGRPSSDVA